jgi:reverse gyrase
MLKKEDRADEIVTFILTPDVKLEVTCQIQLYLVYLLIFRRFQFSEVHQTEASN